MDDPLSKAVLRRELQHRRDTLSVSARHEKSLAISKRMIRATPFLTARCVHIYLSRSGEVQTDALIQEAFRLKKRVAVPLLSSTNAALCFSELSRFDPEILETGPFGIRQPRPAHRRTLQAQEIDLWLIPGLGFDRQGNRLGYGKGHYDRALTNIASPIVGLAFDLQIVDRVPAETTDRSVTHIVTESQTLYCRKEKGIERLIN